MKHLSAIVLPILLLLLTACSTTRHIPDDDQLFIGLKKIVYTDFDDSDHAIETQEEVEAALATAPNGALFGSSYYRSPLPIGLWVWNATRNDSNKLSRWIGHAFGKAPVLMSQVNPALHAQVARQVLHSNGYMHGNVTYKELTCRNPKKAKIAYTVTMDSLFLVDTISYVGFTPAMQHIIDSTRSESLIKSGSPFSVSLLDAERTRVSQLLRNNGYYYYQPGYASYLADTFALQNRVQLRLQMADSLPHEVLHPWYIGKINMELRRSFVERMDSTLDRRFLSISFKGRHAPIRPGFILGNMKLRPRQLFSYADYQESIQKINATGVFSSADLQFTPRNSDTLDLRLNCTFDKPYDFYIETNFANRTIGRMGPELKIGLVRRNAFRGGEKLDINLHGSYEWQTDGNSSGNMSTYQYGADVSVEFPRTLIPRLRSQQARLRRMRERGRRPRVFYTPSTTVAKVSSDVVRRPNYYKMHIVSGELTYRWAPSAQSRHELSPLTVKYQYMNSHTELFDSMLTFNPYLQATMDNYFIPKMRYTYTYTSPASMRNPLRWEVTLQQAGNVTALYDVLIQGNKWKEKNKTLFKNPYSQFVKIETDITKTWSLGASTQLVGHASMGVMWSYGNSVSAPFSELFYAGGANSIRAFPVRSIGPGSFPGFGGNNQFSYIMQNGDTKIVANLELRFRLSGNLYGALFLDAGNVWNSEDWTIDFDDLDDDDVDDESTTEFVDSWNRLFGDNNLHLSTFLNQIATGTGIGLRYDLQFLVLRVDWGFGLHLPYDTGYSGYFNIGRFKDMHTLHIAIGYPF
jgi:hypothetical protein